MAVKKNNSMSGLIGSSVSYERNGQECMRSRPKKYNLKKNSELSTFDFGTASGTAKLIRVNFSNLIEHNKDTETHNRLTSIATDIVNSDFTHETGKKQFYAGDVELLMNFQFNIHTNLQRVLRLKFNVHTNADRITNVQLPEFNPQREIKIPKGTSEIRLRANAIAFDFKAKKAELIPYIREISFKPGDTTVPATTFSFDTGAKAGDYIITVLAVNFITRVPAENKAAARKPNPAAIISLEKVS